MDEIRNSFSLLLNSIDPIVALESACMAPNNAKTMVEHRR